MTHIVRDTPHNCHTDDMAAFYLTALCFVRKRGTQNATGDGYDKPTTNIPIFSPLKT